VKASLGSIVVVVGLLNVPVAAQGTDAMERPLWRVGDRWVQSISREPGNWKGREVSTVLKTGEFEGVPAYHIQFDIDWIDAQGNRRKEQFIKIRDMDLTPIGYTDQQSRPIRRHKGEWLRWPLVVGASWHVEGTEEFLTRTGWVRRKVTSDVTVKRTEEVITPAGTFGTFLVSSVHRWFDSAGQPVGHGVEEDWISPQTRIWVKYSFRSSEGSEDGVLVEYRPSP
jgi:hypothetical protein